MKGGEKYLMESAKFKLTVDLIQSAPRPWSDGREQGCAVGVTPFFVMDQTARNGP